MDFLKTKWWLQWKSPVPSEKLHTVEVSVLSAQVLTCPKKAHTHVRIYQIRLSVHFASPILCLSFTHVQTNNHSRTYRKWGLPTTASNPNKVQGQQSGLTELKPPALAFITRNRISRGIRGHMGWGYVSWLCLSVRVWPEPNAHSLVCGIENTPNITTTSVVDSNIKASNCFTYRRYFSYTADAHIDWGGT